MIQEAVAEFCGIKVIATNVQLFDRIVEHIVGETDVFRCWSTSFVAIGWQVGTEAAVQRTQTVANDRGRSYN